MLIAFLIVFYICFFTLIIGIAMHGKKADNRTERDITKIIEMKCRRAEAS